MAVGTNNIKNQHHLNKSYLLIIAINEYILFKVYIIIKLDVKVGERRLKWYEERSTMKKGGRCNWKYKGGVREKYLRADGWIE